MSERTNPHEASVQRAGTQTTTRHHDWSTGESLALAVLHGIASVKDVNPLDLDPLYNSVDLDGVDRMLVSATDDQRSQTAVEFVHENCAVRITATGKIELRTLERPA